jgi:hypothetical protein
METCPVDTGTGKTFPALLGVKIRLPKRKGHALEGPVFISRTAVLPPAIGFHKGIIQYLYFFC